MYNDKFLIVLSGIVVDKFTQGRLLGIFKQYDSSRIYVRIKQHLNLPFVKCCKEVLSVLEIEHNCSKVQDDLPKRKRLQELNYRLMTESDMIVIMCRDRALIDIAKKYNKTILQLKGRIR